MKSLIRHVFYWANKIEMFFFFFFFVFNKCATMVTKPLNFVSYPGYEEPCILSLKNVSPSVMIFTLILRLRAGYKYNTTIAIRSGRISDDCPKFCPCCGKGEQSFISQTTFNQGLFWCFRV